MLVSEVVVEQVLLYFFAFSVGLVVDAKPTFFLDGVALVIKVVFGNGQAAHAVSFKK